MRRRIIAATIALSALLGGAGITAASAGASATAAHAAPQLLYRG